MDPDVSKKRIGFIGLGLMGKPMSRNLLKAGYQVTVFNRSRPAMDELKADGAILGESPQDVASRSDVVIAMVPDSPDVKDVMLGQSGVIQSTRPRMIVIDMSTISPAVERAIAQRFAEKDVEYLDAPVTGGQEGAVNATLSIMVGGAKEALDRSIDVFGAMGKKITYVGPSGAGQIVKACNQLIIALTYVGVGEALVMGTKAGIDPSVLVEAIKDGAARCWALDARAPRVMRRQFSPGFKAKHHLKDLGFVRDLAKEMNLKLEGSKMVYAMFGELVNKKNRGDWDNSSLMTLIEDVNGVEIRTRSSGLQE
jgi:2-hydroxy-3-oxopropionate reductase